jgi:bifunctional UDP-N-acetylglucosamine pyrophosphorylase/glucosamine-1-phosphate N-acetyltransferase
LTPALIVLAAGKGTRMNSDLPKVLHPLAGVPLLHHALAAGHALSPAKAVVVTGHEAAQVASAAQDYDPDIVIVEQTEQLGTAHAVQIAQPALADFEGTAIVLYGDTPFISPQTLEHMIEAGRDHDIVVLGFEAADPGRYGRLIAQGADLSRIVEYKDATDAEREITLCNSGVIACNAALLFDLIAAVDNTNAAGEYYLTDIVQIARSRGLSAGVVQCPESETLGVNSRSQLAEAEAAFQRGARADALDNGVTLVAPDTVYFAQDTVIGRDSVIEPHVIFGPGVTVESGATLRAFSHLEGCHVARQSIIGPYARLRPGAELAENVRVGNFVEIKNAQIGSGAKVNHLSYIGDATIGDRSNIGAGTITCNYDGVMKHHTHIGQDTFIGSNTMLVAPVRVGDGAMTGSGSVITSDVQADALALSRAPQVEIPGLARRLMDKLRAAKARQNKED